jgi:DNA-binding LacI/PurR family transcriptional regulator
MQQIAQAAGVSVTTVSHTLSGNRPVNPATAARIRRIIADLDYVPDTAGKRLASGRSKVLGLAVPDISQWYFARMARGAEMAADELDYSLVVSSIPEDRRLEKRYLNLLRTRMIDGLIYSASRAVTDGDELSRVAAQFPVVLADEALPSVGGVSSVVSDNLSGGRLVGQHLTDLGHRRAVVLAGPAGLLSTVERVRGFHEFFPHALVLHGEFEQSAGYRLTSDLIASDAEFTAIFAGNDYMAWGAQRRLLEAGIEVPGQVSVVGFDDIDIAELLRPTLTTVRQDTLEMGRRAAQLVVRAVEGRGEATLVDEVLPVQLMIRRSTGPVRSR